MATQNLKTKNLQGQTFGRWTVKDRAPSKGAHSYWNCLCDCGKSRIVAQTSLLQGKSVSCGCFQKERIVKVHTKHSSCNTPEYHAWAHMKDRCTNPNNP